MITAEYVHCYGDRVRVSIRVNVSVRVRVSVSVTITPVARNQPWRILSSICMQSLMTIGSEMENLSTLKI